MYLINFVGNISATVALNVISCNLYLFLIQSKNDRGKRRLQIASVVCLIFVIAEFIAGIFAKSIAVQADAAHMLTDLMSFGVSLVALRISDMKATKSFTFGYVRAEVLGALMSIVILWS